MMKPHSIGGTFFIGEKSHSCNNTGTILNEINLYKQNHTSRMIFCNVVNFKYKNNNI